MRQLERVLKALANRRRLAIIRYLHRHPAASVGQVAAAIRLSFRSTSKHLAILRAVNLVDGEQHGLQIFYSLTAPLPKPGPHVLSLLELV